MKEFVMQYWYEVLSGIVSAVLAYAYKKLKRRVDKQKLIETGMLAILHDRLYQLGREYIERGRVTLEELKNMEYLYESYHELGGNGTGTEIWERVKNLPVK